MQSLLLKLGDRNANRNTDDEADLHGLRLVAVSETDEGMRFDASKVKRLVDTDHIRAMRKFEHSFEFKPSHKLWLCCNRMPKVDGNDDAMKRRLKKIPFLVQVPPDERDEDLGDKLQLESSGVLNWMLKGLAAWFADGRRLNEPKEIQDAVGEYFHDHDSFGSFLCDEIENNCAAKTAGSSVYAAYNLWANANGMDFKLTKIEFGRRMAERGYRSIPYHGVRHFVGCSLLRGDRFQYQPSVETVKDDGPKF
jgi:putative DNA primase/helicase